MSFQGQGECGRGMVCFTIPIRALSICSKVLRSTVLVSWIKAWAFGRALDKYRLVLLASGCLITDFYALWGLPECNRGQSRPPRQPAWAHDIRAGPPIPAQLRAHGAWQQHRASSASSSHGLPLEEHSSAPSTDRGAYGLHNSWPHSYFFLNCEPRHTAYFLGCLHAPGPAPP